MPVADLNAWSRPVPSTNESIAERIVLVRDLIVTCERSGHHKFALPLVVRTPTGDVLIRNVRIEADKIVLEVT